MVDCCTPPLAYMHVQGSAQAVHKLACPVRKCSDARPHYATAYKLQCLHAVLWYSLPEMRPTHIPGTYSRSLGSDSQHVLLQIQVCMGGSFQHKSHHDSIRLPCLHNRTACQLPFEQGDPAGERVDLISALQKGSLPACCWHSPCLAAMLAP